jgi:hypothetical protein
MDLPMPKGLVVLLLLQQFTLIDAFSALHANAKAHGYAFLIGTGYFSWRCEELNFFWISK